MQFYTEQKPSGVHVVVLLVSDGETFEEYEHAHAYSGAVEARQAAAWYRRLYCTPPGRTLPLNSSWRLREDALFGAAFQEECAHGVVAVETCSECEQEDLLRRLDHWLRSDVDEPAPKK